MVDPLNDTQYTCEILDGGKEPIVSSTNIWWFSPQMRHAKKKTINQYQPETSCISFDYKRMITWTKFLPDQHVRPYGR